MRRLRVLTWHTHGSYLHYLTHAPHDFFVVSKPGRPPGYAGVTGHLPWGPNVHDLPASEVKNARLDCVLFQDDAQYLVDQHELLSDAQRKLPKIYLEHDPPRRSPFDSRHPVAGEDALLVHVTHFNALAWDSGDTPTRVIEHGVEVPAEARYTGELYRGLVIVNNLASRGRRLGLAARQMGHAGGHHLQAGGFEAREDLTDRILRDGIGLDDRERALDGHQDLLRIQLQREKQRILSGPVCMPSRPR